MDPNVSKVAQQIDSYRQHAADPSYDTRALRAEMKAIQSAIDDLKTTIDPNLTQSLERVIKPLAAAMPETVAAAFKDIASDHGAAEEGDTSTVDEAVAFFLEEEWLDDTFFDAKENATFQDFRTGTALDAVIAQKRLAGTKRKMQGIAKQMEPKLRELHADPTSVKKKATAAIALNTSIKNIEKQITLLSETDPSFIHEEVLFIFDTLAQMGEVGCEKIQDLYHKLPPVFQNDHMVLRTYLHASLETVLASPFPTQEAVETLRFELQAARHTLPAGEGPSMEGKLLAWAEKPLEALPLLEEGFSTSKSLQQLIFLLANADAITKLEGKSYGASPQQVLDAQRILDTYSPLLQVLVERDGGVATLNSALAAELSSLQEAAPMAKTPMFSEPSLATTACVRGSYNYRGMTGNSVGGNFRFGGLVPDQVINNADRKVFSTLVHTPLIQVVDPEKLTANQREMIEGGKSLADLPLAEAADWADIIARQRFLTDERNLEDLQSEGHGQFEELFSKARRQMGIAEDPARRKEASSRTNISAALMLGIGDCRQHAQVKQLIWDTLQREQVNAVVEQYTSGAITQETMQRQSQELLALDLRTFDVEVHSHTKIAGMYDEVRDAEGNLQYSAEETVPEEHTMNILVNHKTGETRLADAFYHKRYAFGSGRLPEAEVVVSEAEARSWLKESGTPRPTDRVVTSTMRDLQSTQGRFRILADYQEVWDPERVDRATGKKGVMVRVPVYIEPTAYAGKRDTLDPVSETIYCLGSPLARVQPGDIVSHSSAARRAASYAAVITP